jgi:urease accessory protein
MPELTLIQRPIDTPALPGRRRRVRLTASRGTLGKRRWRGVAEDGREFGFDLENGLNHGSVFFEDEIAQYVVEQEPEQVLEIPIATLDRAASVAWNLGNLHFVVQILPRSIRVPADSAVRQFLHREGIDHEEIECVFLPQSSHAHHHRHHHE